MKPTVHVHPPEPDPTIAHYTVIDFLTFAPPVELGPDVGTFDYDGTDDATFRASGGRPTLDRGGYDTIVTMTDGTVYRARMVDVDRYLTDNGYER